MMVNNNYVDGRQKKKLFEVVLIQSHSVEIVVLTNH
jgi:hypothetical protein